MSSANLRADLRPDRAKLDQPDRAALDRALAVVAEESFFAMVDPVPDDLTDLVPVPSDRPSLVSARVTFDGGFAGALCCTMPRALAHELTAAFSGAAPEAISVADPAVDDVAGEFANMVCGRWLTDIAPQQLFSLAHPSVEPLVSPRKGAVPSGLLNGQPVWIELSLNHPNAQACASGTPA
jgi:hypothetical protein